MTDKDPRETEGSGGGDGGGETPPPGQDQEKGYDIREEVNETLDSLFAGLDEDEDVVDAPADDEDVVAVPAADEDVVDVPAADEAVVDVPAADEDVVDAPADEEDVVTIPADDEDVVDVPAADEAVVDVPVADEDIVDVPADDNDVVEGLALDEDLVGALTDDEELVDLLADNKDSVDVLTDEPAAAGITPEIAVDTPFQETDAMYTPPPTEAVTPVPLPATGGKPKKGEGVSPPPENKKPKVAVKAQPPKRNQPAPPPAEPKPRKPLTSRILVWGAVLIIITLTVRYFVTYSSEELATAPVGKPGLLFHKVVPVPSPVASSTPAEESAPAPPAEESAPTPPAEESTPPPAVKELTPPPAVKESAPAPAVKESAPAPPATGTVKAYVPKVYPYAIHIASIKSLEEAKGKLVYYHRGIQAYLVRTDLGKKGVWYRLFFGHFPSATAAAKAIKDNNFTGSLVSRTRYTCLLGSYPALAPAEATTQLLAGKGFLPYTIIIGDTYHVFVGAHPTRPAAEALLMDLSAAGFSSELIER